MTLRRRKELLMEKEQQQINEAAEQFADAVKTSYQAVAKRGGEAQELNAELTQQFFNRVNENLRTHAEANKEMTQALRDQQERQQEAGKQIAQESVGAYMDFMNSMFSYSQGAAQGGAKKTR
jgi:predicted ATP-dependent endonuclease of OLD family